MKTLVLPCCLIESLRPLCAYQLYAPPPPVGVRFAHESHPEGEAFDHMAGAIVSMVGPDGRFDLNMSPQGGELNCDWIWENH